MMYDTPSDYGEGGWALSLRLLETPRGIEQIELRVGVSDVRFKGGHAFCSS